jgi:hypothetical protein
MNTTNNRQSQFVTLVIGASAKQMGITATELPNRLKHHGLVKRLFLDCYDTLHAESILLVLFVMAVTGVWAQTSYWPDFIPGDYEDNKPFVVGIMIDGVIITADYEDWDQLEVAAFVGDECRSAESRWRQRITRIIRII